RPPPRHPGHHGGQARPRRHPRRRPRPAAVAGALPGIGLRIRRAIARDPGEPLRTPERLPRRTPSHNLHSTFTFPLAPPARLPTFPQPSRRSRGGSGRLPARSLWRKPMKRITTLVIAGLFALTAVGCQGENDKGGGKGGGVQRLNIGGATFIY